MPIDRVGNTANHAKPLRIAVNSPQREWIGAGDPSDFYRFRLDRSAAVQIGMQRLKANADLALLNADRQVLQISKRSGRQSESIAQTLTAGTYFLRVSARSGSTAYRLTASAVLQPDRRFSSFSVVDASGDSTANTLFQSGALRWSYSLEGAAAPVRLEAWQDGSFVATIATSQTAGGLVNLANFPTLSGDYQFRAVSDDAQTVPSDSIGLRILSWDQASSTQGTFSADTLFYPMTTSRAQVMVGRGGTDTLRLQGIVRASITSLDGQSLDRFDSIGSTASQAIFHGTAYDYLTLADGRELYFRGLETLSFADGSTLDLQVRPTDPDFPNQWNLHATDVDSAWRFTQGSDRVLLVSLDTGLLTAPGASGSVVDLTASRLLTDPSDDDNYRDNGHGHQAISIMAATPNNAAGIAGINWKSPVLVADVYYGTTVQQAIASAIAYARTTNQRLVFQGGVQTDYWLTQGGTQTQLEALIRSCADVAMFAIAAGNGGVGGGSDDPDYLTSVNGIARLETSHENVLSVGAAESKDRLGNWASAWVNGLLNASEINLAPYSNRGSNLTIVAPTDSPAIDKYGALQYFNGTSSANPNLAAIASLVWSVNPSLSGAQVRQILTQTAIDLGAPGRDPTFGYGLVDADAAVRRAWALARDSELANLAWA